MTAQVLTTENEPASTGVNVSQEKVRLVVLNEHTLGYIDPRLPNIVAHLHASVLRGAPSTNPLESSVIGASDHVRLASEADFDAYRVQMRGYLDDDAYVYATLEPGAQPSCILDANDTAESFSPAP